MFVWNERIISIIAYYDRRRFQLRVEEAIRRGQPLPQDAVRALGLDRPKKGKDFGPMPSMWEVELKRDDEKVEWRDETDWRGIKVSDLLDRVPKLGPR